MTARRRAALGAMALGAAAVVVGLVGMASEEGSETGTAPTTTTPTTTVVATEKPSTTALGEMPGEFVATVLRAIADRDVDFLVSRLAQATFDRYGRTQCEQAFAHLDDPTDRFEVREVGTPGPFDYVTDGISRTIDDAVPVEIARVIAGQTAVQEQHVTRASDGTFRFYSDCGEPIEGAI